MGEVVGFKGGPVPGPSLTLPPPRGEPDPSLIAVVEMMLDRARRGELTAFIAICERPRGKITSLLHTAGSPDLCGLLAGLEVEVFRLAGHIAQNTTLHDIVPEDGG